MMGTLLIQGCIIAPFALLSMSIAGYSEIQFILITLSTFAILITNLAVLPQRIVIPVFAISTFTQLFLILINTLAMF